MPAQKSPFFVGPSASRTKGGPPPKTDEQIREEQRKNLSPFKRKLIDLLDRYAIDPISNFTDAAVNVGPFTTREEGAKHIKGKSGALGVLAGNGLFEFLGPIVGAAGVAYQGGKNLPKLREASKAMLEGIDLSRMPDWFADWATYMLEKYPRTLAHNTKIGPMNPRDARRAVGTNHPSSIDPKLSEISLSKEAYPDTGFHEIGHTIQGITEPKFTEAYDQLNDIVGYHNNPFEIEANKLGLKQQKRFIDWREKYNPRNQVRSDPDLYNEPWPPEPSYAYDPFLINHFDENEWGKEFLKRVRTGQPDPLKSDFTKPVKLRPDYPSRDYEPHAVPRIFERVRQDKPIQFPLPKPPK